MTLHDVRPAPCFEPRSAGNLTGITTSGGTLRVGRACRSQTLYQFESVLKISCFEKLLRADIRLHFRFKEFARVKLGISSNRMGGQNLPSPFKLYPCTFTENKLFKYFKPTAVASKARPVAIAQRPYLLVYN